MTSFKWLFKTHYKKKWKFSDLRDPAKVDLVLHALVFDGFLSLIKNKSGSYRAVYNCTFEWPSFIFCLTPQSHVILHAGLAWSCRIHCLMNAIETFSPRKWCSIWRMKGKGKSSSSVLTHLLRWAFPGGQGWSFRWWILQLHTIVDPSVKTVSSKIR